MRDPLTIGPVSVAPPVVLAPMAGVTDSAFRQLCCEQGAGMVFSEMVSAEGLVRGNPSSWDMVSRTDHDCPFGLQLFGHDPGVMQRAVAAVSRLSDPPDLIDLNMGCPVRKVVRTGAGAAIMLDIELAQCLVAAAREAAGPIPVTAKIRSGWDDDAVNARDVAVAIQSAGADAVTVHGRTRSQMYRGAADWQVIRQVRGSLSVPVIGNGDVVDAASALRMFAETGVSGVMVGRAALGNPWVFADISAALAGRAPGTRSREDIVAMMLRHLDLLVSTLGCARGPVEMRKHAAWYVRGIPGARAFRQRLVSISSRDDLRRLGSDLLGC